MKPPDLSPSLREAASQAPARAHRAAVHRLVPGRGHPSLPSVRHLEAHRDKHQEAGLSPDKVLEGPLVPLYRLMERLAAKLHSVPLSHLQAGASPAAAAAHLAHQALAAAAYLAHQAQAAEFPLVPVRVQPLVSLVKLQEVQPGFQAVKVHQVLVKRHHPLAQAGKIILQQGSKRHLQALLAQALVHRPHQHLLNSPKHQRLLSDRHKQQHLLSDKHRQKLSAGPKHRLQLQLLPLDVTPPKNPIATNLQNRTEAAAQPVLLNSLLSLKVSEKTRLGQE